MTSFAISTMLDKAENRDKDFRYMAANDLLNELGKESFKPDSDGEKKICRTIVKLLNDQSSDVQGLAVKCLPPLVRTVHQERVDEIMVTLCDRVLEGKDEQRDIASIGLKTVVLEMPSPAASALGAVRQLTHKLVSGVRKESLEIKLECLDILNDLLKRFGAVLREDESKECLSALFHELGSARAAARKRAIACIASISAGLSDKQLGVLVDSIVSTVGGDVHLRRTYIQMLSAISRSGGYRLGKQLDRVVPLVLGQCTAREEEASPGAPGNDPDMIEACLHAFESFVQRWPKEVAAFQGPIAEKALEFLRYDPNYADDDGEEEDEDEEDMEEDDDDDGEYSDDDDTSWKVRRAAAKVLSAIVVGRGALKLGEVLRRLVSRFREREENVKMDVFATFNDLLAQVGAARAAVDADAMAVDGEDGTAAGTLQREVPLVVKAVARQLREKSAKTRAAAFHCLRNLAYTLPGCLTEHAELREVRSQRGSSSRTWPGAFARARPPATDALAGSLRGPASRVSTNSSHGRCWCARWPRRSRTARRTPTTCASRRSAACSCCSRRTRRPPSSRTWARCCRPSSGRWASATTSSRPRRCACAASSCACCAPSRPPRASTSSRTWARSSAARASS